MEFILKIIHYEIINKHLAVDEENAFTVTGEGIRLGDLRDADTMSDRGGNVWQYMREYEIHRGACRILFRRTILRGGSRERYWGRCHRRRQGGGTQGAFPPRNWKNVWER